VTLTELIGRLLGLEEAQTIEGLEFSLVAPWIRGAPAWVFFGCLGLIALAAVYYGKYHPQKPGRVRMVLGALRAIALCLLLLLLAEPILTVTVTSRKRPALWFLFDGTNSMAIADDLSEAERGKLAEAVGLSGNTQSQPPETGNPIPSGDRPSRVEYVKALLRKEGGNLLDKLEESFRLRAFLFDRPDGVRLLELSADGRQGIDGDHLAKQLTTDGEVTALGAALDDLARRHATGNLAGLVIVSDFDQNAGPSPLTAAQQLNVKLYTVGVGSTAQSDVAVSLDAPLIMKKAERSTVSVGLWQQGLVGESVSVSLSARQLIEPDGLEGDPIPVGEKTVVFSGPTMNLDFPFVPEEAGRFVFAAEVEPVAGEVVQENNQARREVTVRDDFLRLLFVEYEPTWEWRFIKEVFHRDKLVGLQGFRTFLRSSAPHVRQTNPMFLPTMAPARSEFFEYDVIFLGDVPASALSSRFCEMTREFVKEFGGGLVILSGPNFGPGELLDTPLADLLPVKIEPGTQIHAKESFRPRLTPHAARYDFMQLGADAGDNETAWDNLGKLPWYHPVQRLNTKATALAEHPSHTCVDGKTRQPLIAIQKYGRGEVVYLGFNETWRLRRRYGERYYRQFWGQMIHRLGLSHALGSQKRFVVRTDRRSYRTEDMVLLTVEAYDGDFKSLAEEDLPDRQLNGELVLPVDAAIEGDNVQPLAVTQLREGEFETRFPVYAEGEHRVRVVDPITEEPVEITFRVTGVAVERQSALRNVALQEQIAHEVPGGESYDLTNVAALADEIELTPKTERDIQIITLWHTWAAFFCLAGLLLAEWFLRKWVNLS